jgi:hypothetical protein
MGAACYDWQPGRLGRRGLALADLHARRRSQPAKTPHKHQNGLHLAPELTLRNLAGLAEPAIVRTTGPAGVARWAGRLCPRPVHQYCLAEPLAPGLRQSTALKPISSSGGDAVLVF